MHLLHYGAGMVLLMGLMGWPGGVRATTLPPVLMPPVSVATSHGAACLSVTASGVPLQALLSEVARQGNFTVTGAVSRERLIAVEFLKVPLAQAIRKLLAGENFIFLYDQSAEGRPATLRRVILLGSRAPAEAGTPVTSATDLADVTGVPAVEEPAAVIPEGAEAFDPESPLEDLLPLTDHQDPRMRTAALEALTLHEGDARARRTLMDHSADPDPNIRLLVVGLLGPFVTPWPGAEEVVMSALRDPVTSVRQLALQIMWEASSPALADALQLARHDEDAAIRARAEELLLDVPNQ